MRRASTKRIAAAVRTYRVLCRAYPRMFRDRFGHELEVDFRHQCEDAFAEQGSVGLYALWAHALLDVIVNVPAAHWSVRDGPRWADQTRITAYVLMVVGVPLLVLFQVSFYAKPADVQVVRLAGLAMYCTLGCAVSIVVRRFAGLTLPIACTALASLLLASLRSPSAWDLVLRAPMSPVIEALRLFVPAAIAIVIVNVAPLPTARTRSTAHALGPSTE